MCTNGCQNNQSGDERNIERVAEVMRINMDMATDLPITATSQDVWVDHYYSVDRFSSWSANVQ